MNELFVSNLISKEMNDVILFQHLLKISTRYFISHDLVGVGFYFIRFLDQDLDDIGGIPRLLDAGRCNDAYSDIRIASALAHAFGAIDLPLFRIISW